MVTVRRMDWKKPVNSALRKATGYELRRPPSARSATAPSPQPLAAPVAPAAARTPAPPALEGVLPSRGNLPPRENTAPLPPARLEVGEAKSAHFFDNYPRLAMSRRSQMNLRYDALIHQNRDLLRGARVLDLACSEGSYSFGALHVGAAHVLGIESREDKVANARGHFAALGVAPDRYEFIAGDLFKTLENQKPQVDVVMCLGYIYHTLRYPELLSRIEATGAQIVIVDGEVAVSDEPIVRVIEENAEFIGNASGDQFSFENTVLSGRPSVPALEKMMRVYGFAVERRADWAAIFRDNPDATFSDYSQSRRASLVWRRTDDRTWRTGASRV